ncbi:unnamed protein product [Effrenium voratum]|uniref:MYND-type domain-containing protein n=1 Tax=Effrenium voratum TaxID=2562239 RepID=A0AA36JE09_9DINO|nr:unnamed protein product [Effrenium voratum]CAJ1414964.1 unnamed protein product [Effrenium voratum]
MGRDVRVLDPADFHAEDETCAKVLAMAFGKMEPKKRPSPKAHAAKPAAPPAAAAPAAPVAPVEAVAAKASEKASERKGEDLLAKIKAQGRKATPEELEELLESKRAAWRASAPSVASAASGASACAGCGGKQPRPFQCGTCKTVRYCSPECQKSHWKEHKRRCRKRVTANICVLSDFA